MPHTVTDFHEVYGPLIKKTADSMRDAVQHLLRANVENMKKLPGDPATKVACIKEIEDSVAAYDAFHAKSFP